MKRVFIVHGWDGYPEEGWFPWLKQELEARGFRVVVPQMPSADEPVIEKWVSHLTHVVGVPDRETYFVGHSIGCQTIMRYLAGLPRDAHVGGVVFVAGFFTLMNIDDANHQAIARPWLETSIDVARVRDVARENITAIFSKTDVWVPFLENEKVFREKLRARIIIEAGGEPSGHFSGSDGVKELPVALDAVLKISQ